MKKLSLFGIIFILIISACGDYSNRYSDTGSVVFKIEFEQPFSKPNNPDNQTQNYYATGDVCVDYGIETITWQIIDSSSSIVESKEYLCSAHQGTITGILAGSYKFRLNGANKDGAVSWRGEKPGVTISSGQTTDGGKIIVTQLSGTTPTAPIGVTATAGSGQVTISWSNVSGATSYNIYYWTVNTRTKFSNVTSPYTRTGLTSGTTYYYVITAENSYGESSESSQVSAIPTTSSTGTTTTGGETTTTIDTNDITTPSSPSVSINSGASSTTSTSVTLTLSATDSVGVTGYYASEASTTPSASASGWTSVTSTTSYYSASESFTLSSGDGTKTVYIWFKDAAGNVSSSANDSITLQTPISWTMLKLPDTGQTNSYTTTFGEDHDYTINSPSYTDNGNGTITDNVTGLMWQKEDDNTKRTWTDAGTYCDNLTLGSQTDWRLPSDMELMSIVNYGTYNPAINATYFPNTNSSEYWSSTIDAGYSSDAWYVGFSYGYVSYYVKTYDDYVRCVRGGQ